MKKTGILLIALTSIVPCVVDLNSASAAITEDAWVSKADMPTARAVLRVATVNEKIYAIGGGGPVGTNEEYDTQNDTWTTKTPMLVLLGG